MRCIGLGMIAQSWGGIMAGTSYSPEREHPHRYRATGQCGFAFMFQVGLFTDPDEYGREMDALAASLKDLAPLEGFDKASYAGGIEGARAGVPRTRHSGRPRAPARPGGHRGGVRR